MPWARTGRAVCALGGQQVDQHVVARQQLRHVRQLHAQRRRMRAHALEQAVRRQAHGVRRGRDEVEGRMQRQRAAAVGGQVLRVLQRCGGEWRQRRGCSGAARRVGSNARAGR